MLNPVILSRAIKDTFADYVATTLSIADERYDELLKTELRKDGIIAKGPYLELGDAYKTGATIRELIADGVIILHLKSSGGVSNSAVRSMSTKKKQSVPPLTATT